MGKWLEANGEATYETTPVEPYSDGNVAYTARGDNAIHGVYLSGNDEKEIPVYVIVRTKLKGKLNAEFWSWHASGTDGRRNPVGITGKSNRGKRKRGDGNS